MIRSKTVVQLNQVRWKTARRSSSLTSESSECRPNVISPVAHPTKITKSVTIPYSAIKNVPSGAHDPLIPLLKLFVSESTSSGARSDCIISARWDLKFAEKNYKQKAICKWWHGINKKEKSLLRLQWPMVIWRSRRMDFHFCSPAGSASFGCIPKCTNLRNPIKNAEWKESNLIAMLSRFRASMQIDFNSVTRRVRQGSFFVFSSTMKRENEPKIFRSRLMNSVGDFFFSSRTLRVVRGKSY